HEDPLHRQFEGGELLDRHLKIGEAGNRQVVVEYPQAYPQGLVAQAVALAEAADATVLGVDMGGGQGQVEQVSEQSPALLDELGIHTGNSQLAQVQIAVRVGLEPAQRG